MFHSKEVKQQLQQAETLGRQVETYEAMLQTAASDVAEAQMDVDQLQMSAAKMDRSLTKVVGYAKDTRDDQQVMEDGYRNVSRSYDRIVCKWDRSWKKVPSILIFTPAGDGIDRPDGAEQALYRTCQVGFGRLQ